MADSHPWAVEALNGESASRRGKPSRPFATMQWYTRKVKKSLSAILAALLLVIGIVGQTPSQTLNKDDSRRPLNLLVLGDSVMWGEGLRTEHKSWYQVKLSLERTTGRRVIERIEAHSGAVIERESTTDRLKASNPEVNVALPTLHEQLDNALRSYVDGSKVDFVLLNGCGNDVGIQRIFNASGTAEINSLTREKCGRPMELLLRRITVSFPAAIIVVAGYYPSFSAHTRNDFILKALSKRFLKATTGTPKTANREILIRLTANSRDWYEASNNTLTADVQNINGEIGGQRKRVMFARIEFPAEFSFAAKQTRLWGFNRSPLKMMLVLLSLGRITLPANDEVRRERTVSCSEVFRRQSNETVKQTEERHNRHLLCRYASLGHPNRKGASLYADAIIALLPTALSPGY